MAFREQDWANIESVAGWLGVSARTIRRLVASGKLPPPLKVGTAARWKKQDIATYLGVKVRDLSGGNEANSPVSRKADDPLLRSDLVRALKAQSTVEGLVRKLKISKPQVLALVEDLEERGYIIYRRGNAIGIGKQVERETFVRRSQHFHGDILSFGVVADMHLCNKACRLDVLNAAYDEFESQGITTVFCPGNYIDGEGHNNRSELVAHGIPDQCQYAIDHWPHRKGITTYYVDGDDHEGWYKQREGIEFGRYLEMEAHAQGYFDLVYMGYGEADFELTVPGGGRSIIKIIHTGGGSSYAFSYASQKLAESFQGGEKPDVCIIGHLHKFDYCLARGVHCVQVGCIEDQTIFMRKKRLAAHVGFTTITIQQDEKGAISRFSPTFYPFFDRNYYLTKPEIGPRLRKEK